MKDGIVQGKKVFIKLKDIKKENDDFYSKSGHKLIWIEEDTYSFNFSNIKEKIAMYLKSNPIIPHHFNSNLLKEIGDINVIFKIYYG